MRDIWQFLVSAIRRGPRFVVMYLRESLLWDVRNGTRTHLRVPKSDRGNSESMDGVLYVASLTSVVRGSLTCAREHLGPERFAAAQFLDLGCGKGKALLVYAAEFAGPQSPIAVGIDYDADLIAIASANLETMNIDRDRAIAVLDSATNADQYIHARELIVYMYNPFVGETLLNTLRNLSICRHILIYIDPVGRSLLAEFGYQIVADHRGRYSADTWIVAEHQ